MNKRKYCLQNPRNGNLKPFSGEQIMSIAHEISICPITEHDQGELTWRFFRIINLHNPSFSKWSWENLCVGNDPDSRGPLPTDPPAAGEDKDK